MTYDPVAGTGYTREAARECWAASMERARYEGPAWSIRGLPESSGGTGFYWSWSDFRHWTGRLTVEADGFHWSTNSPVDGHVMHEGVTTSLYEAYQSIIQGREVKRSA